MQDQVAQLLPQRGGHFVFGDDRQRDAGVEARGSAGPSLASLGSRPLTRAFYASTPEVVICPSK